MSKFVLQVVDRAIQFCQFGQISESYRQITGEIISTQNAAFTQVKTLGPLGITLMTNE